MEKDIKDYIHLYLGCDFKIGKERIVRKLDYGNLNVITSFGYNVIKLILSKLPDITEEQKLELCKIFGWWHNYSDTIGRCNAVDGLFENNGFYNKQTNISGATWSKAINYCRKQGIDMDGLIEAGLAIDKNTLK